MKFVCISDVHIKDPDDIAAQLFKEFLKRPETQSAQTIFLLGDIFDLVVGGQSEYLRKYESIFSELAKLISSGKKIIMFEGNHDFHFKNLIKKSTQKWQLDESSWEYRVKPLRLVVNGEPTLFAHGDEIEIENPTYQAYRTFIRSFPINFLANYVVPQFIVDRIGVNASNKSRERNIERYGNDNNEAVREKFHRVFKNAQRVFEVKNVICGHSHCRDQWESEGLYLNNGFFPKTKTFTYFDGESFKLVEL
jgi:UDP-2,3-diacylglucosamine hydrolase